MIVFPDSLTYVNKKAVFAHNFTKTFAYTKNRRTFAPSKDIKDNIIN